MNLVNDIKTIFRFQKMAASNSPAYPVVLFALSFFSAVQPFIVVVFPRFILDEVFGKRNVNNVIWYLIAMSFCTIICGVLNSILTNKLHFLSMKIKSTLRMNLALQTTKIRYEMLENADILNTKQNATKFLEEDVDKAVYVTPKFFSSIVAACGYIYIISNLNFWIVCIIFIVIIMNTKLQSNVEKYAYKYRSIMSPIERKISYFIMTMPNIKYGKDIRMYSLQNWLYEKYKKQLDMTLTGYGRVFSKRIKNGILTTIANAIQTICVYGWLIYQAFIGNLTIGLFTMYFTAISNFSNNIINIFSSFVQISAVKRGLNDFLTFMDLPQEDVLKNPANIVDYSIQNLEIEFRNVWFRYPGQESFILKDVSIKIPYGQKICIVGENGAGKTTFVKLLTRLYEPTKGEIFINGININEIELKTYRNFYATVFQDFCTFAFTIKENIALIDSELKDCDRQVQNVIKKVGLDEKTNSLPKGIDTYLETVFDDKGIQLSGGQAQKMVLARAMYMDAPILILDEPTAALDPRSEYHIYRNFYNISDMKTVLFITHRLAISRICDRVVVFKNGRIIEDGPHEKLLKDKQIYFELYNMQKQYYNEEKEVKND